MRYVSFRHQRRSSYGYVKGDGVVDLGRRTGLPSLTAHIAARFDVLGTEPAHSPDVGLEEIEFLPVIPTPGKVICVATNYYEDGEADRQVPDYPLLFTRFASSQTGHAQPLIKPSVTQNFDYEGELAVVIGKHGRAIAEADAIAHVAGYSCFNDGSVRDWQKHSTQFTAGKNFACTAGFGPWLVSRDEMPVPAGLNLVTCVNGEVRQSNNTDRMLFSVSWLIAYVSRFAPLEPGDVIVTGTPTGFGSSRKPPVFLQSGDVVEVEIDRIGTLRNVVADEIGEDFQIDC